LDENGFELLGEITDTETIAAAATIREIARLRRRYGQARWRKRKGVGTVCLADGTICEAEIHWYEAHGLGKKELRIKRLFE
jgi:hypothetical protein